jgi:hypothetical protein
MVTYSCDRCGIVVNGADDLKSGTFSNVSGTVTSPIAGAICGTCLDDLQKFISTPIVPAVGATVMEKTMVQAQIEPTVVVAAAAT